MIVAGALIFTALAVCSFFMVAALFSRDEPRSREGFLGTPTITKAIRREDVERIERTTAIHGSGLPTPIQLRDDWLRLDAENERLRQRLGIGRRRCVLTRQDLGEGVTIWLPAFEGVELHVGDSICTERDERGVFRAYVRRENGNVEELPVEREPQP